MRTLLAFFIAASCFAASPATCYPATGVTAITSLADWNNAGYEYGASDEDFIYPELRQHHIQAGSHADYWNIPLYALNEVKHD